MNSERKWIKKITSEMKKYLGCVTRDLISMLVTYQMQFNSWVSFTIGFKKWWKYCFRKFVKVKADSHIQGNLNVNYNKTWQIGYLQNDLLHHLNNKRQWTCNIYFFIPLHETHYWDNWYSSCCLGSLGQNNTLEMIIM